jgi:hypothetical protein
MSDQPLSDAAKIAALEILALVQRAGDDDDIATQVAAKVQHAIDNSRSAGSARVLTLARSQSDADSIDKP